MSRVLVAAVCVSVVFTVGCRRVYKPESVWGLVPKTASLVVAVDSVLLNRLVLPELCRRAIVATNAGIDNSYARAVLFRSETDDGTTEGFGFKVLHADSWTDWADKHRLFNGATTDSWTWYWDDNSVYMLRQGKPPVIRQRVQSLAFDKSLIKVMSGDSVAAIWQPFAHLTVARHALLARALGVPLSDLQQVRVVFSGRGLDGSYFMQAAPSLRTWLSRYFRVDQLNLSRLGLANQLAMATDLQAISDLIKGNLIVEQVVAPFLSEMPIELDDLAAMSNGQIAVTVSGRSLYTEIGARQGLAPAATIRELAHMLGFERVGHSYRYSKGGQTMFITPLENSIILSPVTEPLPVVPAPNARGLYMDIPLHMLSSMLPGRIELCGDGIDRGRWWLIE